MNEVREHSLGDLSAIRELMVEQSRAERMARSRAAVMGKVH